MALLWLVAGIASIVGGLLSEPTRVLALIAGVLFVALAIQSMLRDRRGQSPPTQ